MLKPKNIVFYNFILFSLIFVTITVAWMFLFYFSNQYAAAEEEEADTTPPAITSVNISDISATSSIITWQTDEEADSLVNYGLNKNYGVVRDPHADKIEHKIILEDLLPGMTYYYRITSADAGGNQGISSDFSFSTTEEEKEAVETYIEQVVEEGTGGLTEEGVEEILKTIDNITSEEILEKIIEKIEQTAEEVISPPTIILDYADVEVGVDYAIITWVTDKESNTIVALATNADFDDTAEDPYRWKEGEPDELVTEHRVEVNGLTPATEYHFRVSSESTLGLTGYSGDMVFKTKSILPDIYNIQIAKVQEESATIKWTTNVPCSSIVEYTNLNSSQTKLEGNSSFITVHSIKLSSLIFDTYYSFVIKVESEEGEKAESDPMTFITIRDKFPPVISKVNTESTIYPGSENRIQTIASWYTDEPAMCQLFYHQGLVLIDEPESQPEEEDYGVKHVHVITNFLPSSVYKFWIICKDEALNVAKSDDFTMLTPTQEESIIDIIIKNFESSFGWLKKK